MPSTLLNDSELLSYIKQGKLLRAKDDDTEFQNIIEAGRPIRSCVRNGKEQKCMSYGISSNGYDTRLGTTFKTFVQPLRNGQSINYRDVQFNHDVHSADFYDQTKFNAFKLSEDGPVYSPNVIDPLNFNENFLVEEKVNQDGVYVIRPMSYALGHTVEIFDMTDDAISVCLGKSTYARSGLIVNVTPIEPGFIGQVTLEFFNATHMPIILRANQGICQFLFFRGKRPDFTYADRGGKYQNQDGVTPPRS